MDIIIETYLIRDLAKIVMNYAIISYQRLQLNKELDQWFDRDPYDICRAITEYGQGLRSSISNKTIFWFRYGIHNNSHYYDCLMDSCLQLMMPKSQCQTSSMTMRAIRERNRFITYVKYKIERNSRRINTYIPFQWTLSKSI